ncbi:hypothetical protein FHG87_024849, partial [Trinorchestia longiramus]
TVTITDIIMDTTMDTIINMDTTTDTTTDTTMDTTMDTTTDITVTISGNNFHHETTTTRNPAETIQNEDEPNLTLFSTVVSYLRLVSVSCCLILELLHQKDKEVSIKELLDFVFYSHDFLHRGVEVHR